MPHSGGWWCDNGRRGCVGGVRGLGGQAHAPRSPAERRAHHKPMATRGSPRHCLCPQRGAWPSGRCVHSSHLSPQSRSVLRKLCPASSEWDVSLAPLCHLSVCPHGSDTIYSVCAERVHLCLGSSCVCDSLIQVAPLSLPVSLALLSIATPPPPPVSASNSFSLGPCMSTSDCLGSCVSFLFLLSGCGLFPLPRSLHSVFRNTESTLDPSSGPKGPPRPPAG